PTDAARVVAFSLLLLVDIHSNLKAEGLDLDVKKLWVDTARLFFLDRPEQEQETHVRAAIATFSNISKADHPDLNRWRDDLMKLVSLYVLQWTTTNEELRNTDCASLFGGMLSSLLKATE